MPLCDEERKLWKDKDPIFTKPWSFLSNEKCTEATTSFLIDGTKGLLYMNLAVRSKISTAINWSRARCHLQEAPPYLFLCPFESIRITHFSFLLYIVWYPTLYLFQQPPCSKTHPSLSSLSFSTFLSQPHFPTIIPIRQDLFMWLFLAAQAHDRPFQRTTISKIDFYPQQSTRRNTPSRIQIMQASAAISKPHETLVTHGIAIWCGIVLSICLSTKYIPTTPSEKRLSPRVKMISINVSATPSVPARQSSKRTKSPLKPTAIQKKNPSRWGHLDRMGVDLWSGWSSAPQARRAREKETYQWQRRQAPARTMAPNWTDSYQPVDRRSACARRWRWCVGRPGSDTGTSLGRRASALWCPRAWWTRRRNLGAGSGCRCRWGRLWGWRGLGGRRRGGGRGREAFLLGL